MTKVPGSSVLGWTIGTGWWSMIPQVQYLKVHHFHPINSDQFSNQFIQSAQGVCRLNLFPRPQPVQTADILENFLTNFIHTPLNIPAPKLSHHMKHYWNVRLPWWYMYLQTCLTLYCIHDLSGWLEHQWTLLTWQTKVSKFYIIALLAQSIPCSHLNIYL